MTAPDPVPPAKVEPWLPHLPTENSGECSVCCEPWPCDVAVTWESAHDEFCPRVVNGFDVCSTHLRPGDRYLHATLRRPPTPEAPSRRDVADGWES